MQLVNATKMQAAYNMGMRPDGRELLVVVIKGTFTIPRHESQIPALAAEQAPLVLADEFTGEPGFSAPKYECDFVPVKPRCDVLLNGSAYSPNRSAVERVEVSLRVGALEKSFAVVGNRSWLRAPVGFVPSRPMSFFALPISYDNAFGGVDKLHPDEAKHRFYLPNHAGKGFFYNAPAAMIDGQPLPNTQEPNDPIERPNGKYRPMAFGAIGRAWQPRPTYAGTYDQNWIDNVFPFLPADFDEQYYQSAPLDQQAPYLHGGEIVELTNLTIDGHCRFSIPKIEMPVRFYAQDGAKKDVDAVADTLIIEPDLNRFMVVWRTALPLKKNMFEIAQIVAGQMPAGWYRARELGKQYYGSLRELVADRQEERN